MNLKDAIDFEYPENEMAKPLKNITLSEADSTETFKFKPFEYERGVVTKTTKGVINTIRDMQDLPEQVKIFGKRLSFGFGGYFGDTEEETERKKLNLITAERNLNEAQAERYKYTSGREAESLSYGVGGGIVNYGTMLIPAGLVGGGLKAVGATAKAVSVGAEAAGLGTMGVMELAGQVQDKTPMKDGEIDVEAMTPEWARKATGGTLAYTALSAVTEKYVGFGQQMKMWNKPIKWGGSVTSKALTTLRTTGINALSEGATEGIQDLEAAGIGLIDGTLTMDKLPARLQQAWKSAIIGGIIGGGVGTAAAMKSARNVKKQLREMVAPVVGEQDANTVAEAIYNAGTDDMTKAISIELELSSELKNKHGKVWNSMLAAVSREIEGKPRFMAMTEDERASYANTVAKHFADQVLAEANYRGVTLDSILTGADITYDNGIRIARRINVFDAIKNPDMIPAETKLKRESLLAFIKRNGGIKDVGGDVKSMGAIKQYPGLINNKTGLGLDEMAELAWQNEYWPSYLERPTVNDLIDAIGEGMRGNHRYNTEEQQTFADMVEATENELGSLGIDYENMTAAEIEQAVNDLPNTQSLQREAEFYDNYEPDYEYNALGMTEDEYIDMETRLGMDEERNIQEKKDELKSQIENDAPDEEKEQNLNDVVSSYEETENFDVESLSTDVKQAIFETQEQVNNIIEPTQEKTEETKTEPAEETEQAEEEADIVKQLEKNKNKLPPVGLYGKLLDIAYNREKLTTDELRKKFGNYTQGQWAEYLKQQTAETQEAEETSLEETGLSPETAEAIQEDTLPKVEKEDTTTPDKIEDFGEYIYGARKDLWSGYKEKINKELPENAEDIKLSEYFPEPNYEKLITNGVDVNALATVKAIRDIIPTKPKNTYSYKFDKWVKIVKTFRELTSKIIDGNFSLDTADTLIPKALENQVQLYRMLGYPYFTKAKGYTLSKVYYHQYRPDEWVMTNVYHEGDREGYKIEYNNHYVKVNGNYFFENIQNGIDEIKSIIDVSLAKDKSKDKKVKFDIYYNTLNRNKIFLGKKIRSGKYVDLRTFESVKEAREYLANNYDTLVEELNKLKQNPMTRGEVNNARAGEDYRNGTDVTPEMFADIFGFRGVQFGNWVEQKTRIKDLNEAYDALIDLSKVINVPTRALSLNGTLGLAFGARGRGGFNDVAAAHYEPDQVVINLTKKSGAGSLAHEWFHALDNSFMKKDNKNLGYVSEMANENNPLSHNRPEVMLAFFNLRKALEKSKLFERSKEWDKAKTEDYWSTIREMGARTFEQYVKDKLNEKDVSNDFLVNLISIDSDNNVYLNKDEKEEIYAAYDKLFDTLKTRETEKGIELYQGEKGKTTIKPDAYIIKLLEGADESTLPHEFAHYWITEMWNYVRSGRASEKYMKRWQIISDYLGIKPEQTRLTRGQQEKFASSYEAYLTRGQLPSAPIQSAFDDYDKWLQRVYNDYNQITYVAGKTAKSSKRKKVRLTDTAIKFFQSMTTGTLDAPMLAPKDTGVEVPQTVSAEEVIEPTNEIIETPTTYDTTRVINITEGEKGVSKVFQREAMKHADRIVDELGVSYNKINLEEQAIRAAEWVQNNLEEARKVVNGAAAPEGIIDTAIFIAYENEMLRIGNNAEYQRALKIHSQVQTQRGQAIAAERISTDDVYNPAYWWKKLQKNKETDVARKLFKGDTEALNKMIETETKSIMKQIAGKPKEEQVEALTKLAEKLQKDYKLDTLYQMPDDVNERTVREFIKDTIGVNPDVMAGNEVINKAEQLEKLWENTKDSSGNPSVEAMRAKRELNDLIQAQTPSNALAIWTSIFGRGVMLTSVKSPVLNIISNIEAGFTEGITRRLMYGATEKAVDKTVKEEFSKYAWEVYKASADIVTTMNDYDDDMRIIGEQILHSQGPGAFRAASRKVEEVSFKYLMGAPDAVAKTLAFNDTADLLATKIAKEEGAKDISARATEIYKDAILIKPETEVGQKVREQAQAQAHYTTFTNDSWAARFGLSARNWLNMVGRNKIRLGDLTMKFVKTPANVQMMGLEYGFGSLYTLYNVQEIIKNPQSEISKIAIRAAVRNGLGIALAALLYSMLDPDDYFSEFDTLNPKEKDRMRAMGAMPNSIKIGNRWVSIDYFGQLGIPLVGMLEARRNNGLRSYIQSGLTQAAKIPGIKETKQLIDNMSEYARYDLKPEKIAQMMAGTVLDQARAMTIPAIVNDIAKMTDDYERDTMGGVMDKVISSIPGLRQTLPERYGIQGLVRTEPALSTLLFGSRVKTEQSDKLVREVEKLAGKAEQPSISDVTKYGDLRLLSPEKKVKVRKEFYKAYNAESKKLISKREYQKKSPEDKKKALNKVRSRVVKSLKEKYSNDIQREKRRQ